MEWEDRILHMHDPEPEPSLHELRKLTLTPTAAAAMGAQLTDFMQAQTIRQRIEVKRRTFAQGHLVLVHRMLDELVPRSTIKLTVLSI